MVMKQPNSYPFKTINFFKSCLLDQALCRAWRGQNKVLSLPMANKPFSTGLNLVSHT